MYLKLKHQFVGSLLLSCSWNFLRGLFKSLSISTMQFVIDFTPLLTFAHTIHQRSVELNFFSSVQFKVHQNVNFWTELSSILTIWTWTELRSIFRWTWTRKWTFKKGHFHNQKSVKTDKNHNFWNQNCEKF